MPIKVKAIDTHYAGHRFRSRLEARWAVFMDHLRLEWVYEPDGYKLPSGKYLPDFWLPGWECWLEIKPEAPTEIELQLCAELSQATTFPAVFGIGLPTTKPMRLYCTDTCESGGGVMWWDAQMSIRKDGELCLCIEDATDDFVFWRGDYSKTFHAAEIVAECSVFAPDGSMPISRAADAAKSARFEFGQTPRRSK